MRKEQRHQGRNIKRKKKKGIKRGETNDKKGRKECVTSKIMNPTLPYLSF